MLIKSRVHPKVSAYHVLEGPNDFNQIPFSPPETGANIFKSPETRSPWGPCDLDVWCIIPSYYHYLCWELHVPSTGGVQNSGQANLYHTRYDAPT